MDEGGEGRVVVSLDNGAMGKPVELTIKEAEIAARLEAALDRLWADMDVANFSDPEFRATYDEMAGAAAALHASLAARGIEPQHHGYMLKNREIPASDPEFYNHIHPASDLLKFVKDQEANDDPEDVTLGDEFLLKVFSRRWGHFDHYRLTRTSEGWHVAFGGIEGDCEASGKPYLMENLDHDSINYPSGLGHHLVDIWLGANDQGWSHEQVQDELDVLGGWITSTEKGAPLRGAEAVSAPREVQRLVFLSYASRNEDAVVSFATGLKAAGEEVWMAKLNLKGGDVFDRRIDSALRRASAFVVVLTEASVASDEVLSEIRAAVNTKTPVIPVLAEDCEIPYRLQGIHYVDARGKPLDGAEVVSEVMRSLG